MDRIRIQEAQISKKRDRYVHHNYRSTLHLVVFLLLYAFAAKPTPHIIFAFSVLFALEEQNRGFLKNAQGYLTKPDQHNFFDRYIFFNHYPEAAFRPLNLVKENMAFIIKKKRYKFAVDLTLNELTEVSFGKAILFAKLRQLDGGSFSDCSKREETIPEILS
jgi:hypothetical protein